MRTQNPISISALVALLVASAGCQEMSKSDPRESETGLDTTPGPGDVTYDDADKDGIIDAHESQTEDTDGDGALDYQDEDADGDGVLDKKEAGDDDPLTLPVDSDSDGVPDYLDSDSDNNCIPDEEEGIGDADGDEIPNFADLDNDGDGLLDTIEIGDDCAMPDSDDDGIADYADRDSDGDGVGDVYEAGTNAFEDDPRDSDGDGTPDYLDSDSDGDGTSDSAEGGVDAVDEEPRDTDGDGEYDFEDTDSDGDAIRDDEEDSHGTDPYDADTDDDGFSDGGEVTAGTDPTDPTSVIDGLYVEVPERTEVEEIFEFELSIQMGDIAFLLDTTCSMSGTANAMASEFAEIVSELSTILPDAQYGHATYDDYAFGSYGSSSYSDKPFELRQQITDDVRSMQSALSATAIHGGSDGPESGMEGIYQGATGAGYDQGCDGAYNSTTDVKPFKASPSDPFNGTGGQFYSAGDDSTGDIGGYGFREYALPVIVYATDNYLRDPDSSNTYYNGAPGGCPMDAGSADVISAVTGIGAYLVAVSTNSTLGVPQMRELSTATNSYADTDGDGAADDVLVFTWYGSDAEFRETVVAAIEDLVSAVRFSELSLEIQGDEWGFVTGISPESYTISGEVEGTVVNFTLTFRGVVASTSEDQLFALTLNVLGDGSVLLDTMDIIIVVPGYTY